jgi:hydrogenase expression/formation protein HypE
VDLDSVPVFGLTQRICELLGIDPLGLIGSGSLLISCSQGDVGELLETCAEEGIEATVVGVFVEGEGDATAVRSGRPAELPAFAVDEAARVLS